jgi:uncharacterized protein YcbX
MPRLAGIRLHPIKSLDPVNVSEARIGPNGGLELDRVWALFATDGKWINGKRAPAVHHIRADYAPDISGVTISAPADRRKPKPLKLAFPHDTEAAAKWFTAFSSSRSQCVTRAKASPMTDSPAAQRLSPPLPCRPFAIGFPVFR